MSEHCVQTVVLFAMGGYGSYQGWQIRLSPDGSAKAAAKDLHPKILAGMFFFFAAGAVGGVTSHYIWQANIWEVTIPFQLDATLKIVNQQCSNVVHSWCFSEKKERYRGAMLSVSLGLNVDSTGIKFWEHEVYEIEIIVNLSCCRILLCAESDPPVILPSWLCIVFSGEPRLAECACNFGDINYGIVSRPWSVWTIVGNQLGYFVGEQL